jgi:hypothetical protein
MREAIMQTKLETFAPTPVPADHEEDAELHPGTSKKSEKPSPGSVDPRSMYQHFFCP